MLKNVDWAEKRTYKSYGDNQPIEFFFDGLCYSIGFDLLLGYFSSSAISLLALGFATFLYNGGEARFVVNNILSEDDQKAIIEGETGLVIEGLIDVNDIRSTSEKLDKYGAHFFKCLSWMIANNKLQLKIICPKSGQGISHYKKGIFSDGNNDVGFSGSCNFTAFGIIENLESVEIYLDWEDKRSANFINEFKNDFDDIYNEKAGWVKYIDPKDVIIAIRDEYKVKDINELMIEEKDLLNEKKNNIENVKLKIIFDKMEKRIDRMMIMPRFPYIDGPRQYQSEAYQRWVNNGYKGIFAMATGTGKTITALNCILNLIREDIERDYHVLILVPTIILVEQWEKEVMSFSFKNIYKISSKILWQKEVITMLSDLKYTRNSFVIICTYDSFVSKSFDAIIEQFPSDTILIADEAHNMARPSILNKLNGIKFKNRIGLSATPKRIYDIEGTAAMEAFFNDKEPYVFNYSLDKAIKNGVLCRYYYFPHIIRLTEREMQAYIEISNKLAKIYAIHKEDEEMKGSIEMLLLKRKRIIHKASNKLPSVIDILRKIYNEKGCLKYLFVYVPEGNTSENRENGDDMLEENVHIIKQYTREIAKISDKVVVHDFFGGMRNREEILKQFESGKINVLTSMKCLDEGVDIPRAEIAIFCSSTGNPRQFIQRRGRILRRHADKNIAVIHDLVVIPDYENRINKSDVFNIEKDLIKKELERVMYFASLSENPFYTEDVFIEICRYYNLNIYTIQKELEAI